MAISVEDSLARWEAAKSGRSLWHTHWDDLARVMLPRRLGFAATVPPGGQRTESIFDGTPMQAARGLANALDGFLWPEGEPAFHIRAEDDAINNSEEAQAWLSDAERIHQDELDNPKARFRQARGEKNMDTVVFGTAVMFIGEAERMNNLLFQCLHLKDAAVLWDDEGGPIGMFRLKRPTIRQAMQRFGEQHLSPETRQKISQGEKQKDDRIDVLHAVMLRNEGKPNAMFAIDLPFTNTWIEVAAKHRISDGGFHEFPFVVPRWDTSSGEDYGRSPGMIALPDANTAQAMGETMLVAGQRAADPTVLLPNDGSMSIYNGFPGGLGFYDVETASAVGGNPVFTMETGANMPLTREMQMDVREQIYRAFFRNVLNLPVDGPDMTATEVIQRKEEFIREIGPVFGRMEVDDKAPTIERSFNILLRGGAFPKIPKVLSGQNVRFEYESPIKKIKEQIQAAAARQWALEQMEYATVDPTAIDVVNFEALGRFTHQAAGLPPEIINSAEAVQARAAARQQAQAQAMEMEALERGVGAANQGAEAMNKMMETA